MNRTTGARAHLRDAASVLAFGFGVARSKKRNPEDATALYRWGWLPLVLGCVAITLVAIAGSEVTFQALGLAERATIPRVIFIARAVLLSATLATWAGWYVLRTRNQIAAVRDELLARKADLEKEALLTEQAIGLGAVARILAHEVRGPLNSIAIHSEVLKRLIDADARAHVPAVAIAAIAAEVARLKHFVEDYISYARAAQLGVEPSTVNLRDVALSVVEKQQEMLRATGIGVAVEAPSTPPMAYVDGDRIGYVVELLLRRSRESMHSGGTICIRFDSDTTRIGMSLEDDGEGFGDPAAVFRPFFAATKGPGSADLAIAMDVVRAHAGEIQASNRKEGGGGCVTVWLPKGSSV